MALEKLTRRMFADTLMEMLETMPLEKVRIGELCSRCGAGRQTFYYHFRDRNDLVAWIFTEDYMAALREAGTGYEEAHAARTLERMQEKQWFYRKVFTDQSQNAVARFLIGYYNKLGLKAVQNWLGEEPDEETVYAVRSHTYASIGQTIDWLLGVTRYTPEQFAYLQFHFMPAVLREAYEHFPWKGEVLLKPETGKDGCGQE